MLRLEGITKRYGQRVVLKGLSLETGPGTLTLVSGPNGAGKSTLLRVMAGLSRPDHGTRTCAWGPEHVGFLGHDTLLYPNLTALENLAFWQKLRSGPADENTLFEALDRVGLVSLAEEKAVALSRGTAQRLSLARVLLQSPSLLLLDEPLSGLDSGAAARVRAELARLVQAGTALVWVSHDPFRDLSGATTALLLLPGGGHRIFTAPDFPALKDLLAAPGENAPC